MGEQITRNTNFRRWTHFSVDLNHFFELQHANLIFEPTPRTGLVHHRQHHLRRIVARACPLAAAAAAAAVAVADPTVAALPGWVLNLLVCYCSLALLPRQVHRFLQWLFAILRVVSGGALLPDGVRCYQQTVSCL